MDLQGFDTAVIYHPPIEPKRRAMFITNIIVVIVGLIVAWSGYAAPAYADGRFFVGIGAGPFINRGTAPFFHHRQSGAQFFLHFGQHLLEPFPRAAGPWGSYYPPPTAAPYPIAPQEIPQRGFSGTDASGGLYVDGYRVMPSGWLRVQIEPSDATVLIDGFPVAFDQTRGTSASKGLAVGSHQIEVYKAGLQKYQMEVEVKQAREIFLRIKLDE
jgi:hypothetical protein